MLYEWLDVRLSGWHKLNVHSMGLEVWSHLDLVHVACDYRFQKRRVPATESSAPVSRPLPSINAMVLKHGPRVRPRTESDRSWRGRQRASCAGVRPGCEASLRRRRDC